MCRTTAESRYVRGLLLAFVLAAGVPAAAYEVDESDPAAGAGSEAAWRAEAQWDRVDETGTKEIHLHTTDPQFLTALVSYIPEDDQVPSPRDVLGYIAGTEGKLTRPADTIRYFEALAGASPRVQLLEMGQTEEGRTMHLVVISDEANLRQLDVYKGYTSALADPRRTDEAAMREIVSKAKPIVHITAGLHSPETGPPEMVMELAYRLAVSKHPKIEAIRENVITLITPILEVDGRARQIDWYYRYLTEYETRDYIPSLSPPYWGKYTFHDNNRDGLQISQMLTRNYFDTFFEWHPVYSLDLHESVPLLYVSIGTGPYNRALDPIVISEWQWISTWEVTELQRQGLPGVWTWGFYTGWNPSYLLWVTNNHNALGRFYETFGNSTARTVTRDLSERRFAGKEVTSRQWYRSRPPEKELVWSLRNNTNYMQSGVLASLELVSGNGASLLRNFWQKGFNSLERGREEAPHGWVVPAEQEDRGRLAYLINQLMRQGIEVHQATKEFEIGEEKYTAGDYVVRLDQPYGNHARNLLAVQEFPKEADHRPYDDVSWTLGLIYRVNTVPVKDAAILEVKGLKLLEEPVELAGERTGKKGGFYAIEHRGQNGLITARYMLRDHEVLAADGAFEAGDVSFDAGSWIIEDADGVSELLDEVARRCSLDVHRLRKRPEVATHSLDLPRLALYHNWTSTQDDGWVRYTLEQAGVPFDYINDDDIRAGGLRKRYDVIMMANQGGGNPRRMVHGRDTRFGAMPWTTEEGFESHGVIDSSTDITGGIGFGGMANLEQFLDDDGTLLLMGSSGRLATDMGLVRHVYTDRSDVATPGSLLRTKVVRPDHPIGYGFDEVHHVFRVNGPLYDVPERYEHWIVVQYGTSDPPDDKKDEGDEAEGDEDEKKKEKLLLGGFVSGEKDIDRKGVVLDVPRHAGGRVILYSFNPLHRHLNHGDHNYVYNAILNWNDFPDPEPKDHPGLALD